MIYRYTTDASLQNNNKDIVCIYCFDPRHYTVTKFGSLKTGLHRARMLIESLSNLRKNLRSLGQDLIVAHDVPEICIPRLVGKLSEVHVLVQGEVTFEEISTERRVEEQIIQHGGQLIRIFGGNTLYHPEDSPYSEGLDDFPDMFTTFREKVEKTCSVRPLLPMIQAGQLGSMPQTEAFQQLLGERCSNEFLPTAASLYEGLTDIGIEGLGSNGRAVMNFEGGEDAALRRVQDWMFSADRLKNYFEIRNGMLGEAYSSKLSPWLALGCISPRLSIVASHYINICAMLIVMIIKTYITGLSFTALHDMNARSVFRTRAHICIAFILLFEISIIFYVPSMALACFMFAGPKAFGDPGAMTARRFAAGSWDSQDSL